ncbi:hypothetical protein ACFWJT_12085 [Streptomyces sp. NPDC127069]|uniref:hypothetical protein n=1 Tax=Streptomyces sp. NPDC127069 TaxID=3347128 RepID=UPI00365F368E
MPRLTGKWKDLPTDLPSAHRELVEMLRRLRDCSHRSQADIASSGFLVESTLSNHLNGVRIPEEPQVSAFFKAISDELKGRKGEGPELPCSLDELLELRRLARVQHCACVPHPQAGTAPVAADASPAFSDSRPAMKFAAPRGSRTRRRFPPGKTISRLTRQRVLARRQVPVPPAEGDRPRTGLPAPDWTELETLTAFLADGRSRDAGLLLWRAGRTLSPVELVAAVGACRAAGLADAAEAVLTSVSERSDKQAVLNIAAAFQYAERAEDVAFLLSAAQGH